MKVLVVVPASASAKERRKWEVCVARWLKEERIASPKVSFRLADNVADLLYRRGTDWNDSEAPRRFDTLDLVIVIGNTASSRLPWQPDARQVQQLVGQCVRCGRPVLAVGWGVWILSHVMAVGFEWCSVLNGNGRGGDIRDSEQRCEGLRQLRALREAEEAAAEASRRRQEVPVILDDRWGDLFLLDDEGRRWQPVGSAGMRRWDKYPPDPPLVPHGARGVGGTVPSIATRVGAGHGPVERVVESHVPGDALSHPLIREAGVASEFPMHCTGRWRIADEILHLRFPMWESVVREDPRGVMAFLCGVLCGILALPNDVSPVEGEDGTHSLARAYLRLLWRDLRRRSRPIGHPMATVVHELVKEGHHSLRRAVDAPLVTPPKRHRRLHTTLPDEAQATEALSVPWLTQRVSELEVAHSAAGNLARPAVGITLPADEAAGWGRRRPVRPTTAPQRRPHTTTTTLVSHTRRFGGSRPAIPPPSPLRSPASPDPPLLPTDTFFTRTMKVGIPAPEERSEWPNLSHLEEYSISPSVAAAMPLPAPALPAEAGSGRGEEMGEGEGGRPSTAASRTVRVHTDWSRRREALARTMGRSARSRVDSGRPSLALSSSRARTSRASLRRPTSQQTFRSVRSGDPYVSPEERALQEAAQSRERFVAGPFRVSGRRTGRLEDVDPHFRPGGLDTAYRDPPPPDRLFRSPDPARMMDPRYHHFRTGAGGPGGIRLGLND